MLKLIFLHTDSCRFKILKACYNKVQEQDNGSGFLKEEEFLKLEKNYSIFEKIDKYNAYLKEEEEKLQKNFDELLDKAKLYFIHYYKALYMAIERGELTESIAGYYNLKFPFNIPDPKTAEDLLEMAGQLFKYDDERIGNGGKYFANPSIGSVKVWIEKFIEVYEKKTNKYNIKQAEIENIENIRKETDCLIYDIYAILLNEFSQLPIDEQISRFSEYGLVIKNEEEPVIINTEEKVSDIIEIDEQEVQEVVAQKIPKRRKSRSLNQLQFSLFFPE